MAWSIAHPEERESQTSLLLSLSQQPSYMGSIFPCSCPRHSWPWRCWPCTLCPPRTRSCSYPLGSKKTVGWRRCWTPKKKPPSALRWGQHFAGSGCCQAHGICVHKEISPRLPAVSLRPHCGPNSSAALWAITLWAQMMTLPPQELLSPVSLHKTGLPSSRLHAVQPWPKSHLCCLLPQLLSQSLRPANKGSNCEPGLSTTSPLYSPPRHTGTLAGTGRSHGSKRAIFGFPSPARVLQSWLHTPVNWWSGCFSDFSTLLTSLLYLLGGRAALLASLHHRDSRWGNDPYGLWKQRQPLLTGAEGLLPSCCHCWCCTGRDMSPST